MIETHAKPATLTFDVAAALPTGHTGTLAAWQDQMYEVTREGQ